MANALGILLNDASKLKDRDDRQQLMKFYLATENRKFCVKPSTE